MVDEMEDEMAKQKARFQLQIDNKNEALRKKKKSKFQ